MPRADTRFLCERCGYDLGATPHADACPECGTPPDASRPGRRVGSPWQRSPGVVGWFGTMWGIFVSPRVSWDACIPEVPRSVALLLVNAAIGASVPALSLYIDHFTRVSANWRYVVSFFGVSWLVLLAMSAVEYVGIRYFGARRGWRVDAHVASCVVCHASFGWIVLGTLVGSAWHAQGAAVAAGVLPNRFNIAGTIVHSVVPLMIGAVVIGVVIYETLVYVGVRRMKFANR